MTIARLQLMARTSIQQAIRARREGLKLAEQLYTQAALDYRETANNIRRFSRLLQETATLAIHHAQPCDTVPPPEQIELVVFPENPCFVESAKSPTSGIYNTPATMCASDPPGSRRGPGRCEPGS